MIPSRGSFFGSIPNVIKNLLIVNILVFFIDYVLEMRGFNLSDYFALYNFQSPNFKSYQLVTHMFMHGSITHLFFNMFALYMFGRMLEMVWGPKRFLIYYALTGIGAAVIHNFVNYYSLTSVHADMMAFVNTPSADAFLHFVREHVSNPSPQLNDFISAFSENDSNAFYINEASIIAGKIYEMHLNIPTVGASGAVFGVLLAFGMLFPNTQLMLLFPPIPIKAKYFVAVYGLIELFAGVMPSQGDNVAHFAHLGGMIFGFVLIKYWSSKGIGKYDQF